MRHRGCRRRFPSTPRSAAPPSTRATSPTPAAPSRPTGSRPAFLRSQVGGGWAGGGGGLYGGSGPACSSAELLPVLPQRVAGVRRRAWWHTAAGWPRRKLCAAAAAAAAWVCLPPPAPTTQLCGWNMAMPGARQTSDVHCMGRDSLKDERRQETKRRQGGGKMGCIRHRLTGNRTGWWAPLPATLLPCRRQARASGGAATCPALHPALPAAWKCAAHSASTATSASTGASVAAATPGHLLHALTHCPGACSVPIMKASFFSHSPIGTGPGVAIPAAAAGVSIRSVVRLVVAKRAGQQQAAAEHRGPRQAPIKQQQPAGTGRESRAECTALLLSLPLLTRAGPLLAALVRICAFLSHFDVRRRGGAGGGQFGQCSAACIAAPAGNEDGTPVVAQYRAG